MNESDFENDLRALRPIAPAASVEERIAAELSSRQIAVAEPRAIRTRTSGVLVARPTGSERLAGWLRSLGWALAGAAAAVAGVLYFQSDTPRQSPPSPGIAGLESETGDYLPAESESELVEADETGIIYTESAEPFRQMRFRSVERYAWTNPDTGARVEVEVPREDIVLMPVAMQ